VLDPKLKLGRLVLARLGGNQGVDGVSELQGWLSREERDLSQPVKEREPQEPQEVRHHRIGFQEVKLPVTEAARYLRTG
jgi:hypothetical protein